MPGRELIETSSYDPYMTHQFEFPPTCTQNNFCKVELDTLAKFLSIIEVDEYAVLPT